MALDLGTLVAKLKVDNDMQRGLDQGRRALDGFTRDANGRLRDMRGRFASEGDAMGRSLGDGLDRSSRRGLGGLGDRIRGIGDTLGDLGKKGAAGIGQLGTALGDLAAKDPKKTVMILGGAIAGLPLTAGIAASAITVGLGGAIAGIGIKAAMSAKAVKSAFGDLQADMKSGLADAAAPFEGSLVRMIATARKELGSLAAPVRTAFAHLAPAVEQAFGSVSRAVGTLGPTFAYVAQQAAPLVSILGRELGILVKGLAGDFSRLAGAADPRFITIMIGTFRGLSAVLTEIIVKASQFGSGILDLIDKLPFVDFKKPTMDARGLGDAFTKTSAGARELTEGLQDVQDAFAEHLDPSLAVFNSTNRMQQAFKTLKKSLEESKGSLGGTGDAALRAQQDLGGMIQAIRETYTANRAAGDSHDKARAAISRQLQALTKLTAGSKDARDQVNALKKSLDALKDKTVRITTVYSTPADRVDPLTRRGFATGGLVTGPGGPTSDDVPAMLSRGEYVLPASVVKRVGLKQLDALRAGKGDTPGLGPISKDSLGDLTRGSSGSSSVSGVAASIRNKILAQLKRGQRALILGQVKTLKAGLKEIKQHRAELLEDLTSMSADTVKSSAQSLSKMVAEAFKGFRKTTKVDDRLLSQISSTSKRLQKLANQRTKIAERLQEALNFAASVTGRAQQDSSVLGIEVVDEEGQRVDPTGGELATGLRARLATLRKFSGDIKGLAAQGLSKTILRDLMEAGPAAAGGIAAAIGQGGQGVIAELTALQNEIDAASKDLGEFSADHLYDAGAKAGEGFLTGLQGQLDTLENTMEALANRLVETVTNGIAAAQKLAEAKAEKLKSKDKAKPKGEVTDARSQQISGPKPLPAPKPGPRPDKAASQQISGPKRPPAPKAAVVIENYHEAAGGNYRRTGEEILLLTKARG